MMYRKRFYNSVGAGTGDVYQDPKYEFYLGLVNFWIGWSLYISHETFKIIGKVKPWYISVPFLVW